MSGVNVRPGPTLTLCTPEADDDEPEAVAVVLELSVEDADEPESPYCGVARTEAASAETRRVVDVSIECIVAGSLEFEKGKVFFGCKEGY